MLVILAGGFYIAVNRYPNIYSYIGGQDKPKQIQKSYVEAMTEDSYGGKTPQETIDLFVAALKANDAELAAKYFMLDEKSSRDNWLRALTQLKEQGVLPKMAKDVNMASTNTELNKYSGVWKIVNFN